VAAKTSPLLFILWVGSGIRRWYR